MGMLARSVRRKKSQLGIGIKVMAVLGPEEGDGEEAVVLGRIVSWAK